jgi:putative transposase
MDLKKKNALAYDRGLFRYVVLEPLLTSPPAPGELAARLREISSKSHVQRWDQRSIKISVRTLERWYAACKNAQLPTQELQPKVRLDRKQTRVVSQAQKKWLAEYNRKFPSWSVRLLYDNMDAANLTTKIPSYSTILRYFKSQGFFAKSTRSKHHNAKDIRSYEVEFVGQLWHMDFHLGSRVVLRESGEFKQPICMAIIDDKSRLVCHVQWFLNETAEVLVHGLCQAIAKRGMPATFYTDNGSAMKAYELITGLEVLAIKKENTLPYAAYQNGKQESFWKPLEGRLLKMLPRDKRLTLEVLNAATQAWVEQDYHMTVHSETKETPLNRFINEKCVLRQSPSFEDLKKCFRMRVKRAVRKTDGTLTLDGIRFQLPRCYVHLDEVQLRYARWDLGEAEILCPDSLKPLSVIFPLDKLTNSLAHRAEDPDKASKINPEIVVDSEDVLSLSTDKLPPLLARCLQQHSEQNRLSGYVPLKNESTKT